MLIGCLDWNRKWRKRWQACGISRDKVAKFFQRGKDAMDTLLDRLFVRLDDQLGMLRLLIG
jgi:hypothetical protein